MTAAKETRLVDLTLLLAEDLPCYWSTHLPFQHKTWTWYAGRDDPSGRVHNRGGPYTTRWLAIDEHTGTHADAPSHFVPPPGSGLPHAGPAGEVTIDKVPPEQFCGPAAVVDVTALTAVEMPPGISPIIGPELLLDWEREHGTFAAGDIVLFRTGWDQRYRADDAGRGYLHDVVVTGRASGWPAPDPPAMELLLRRGVRCVGTDAPSMGSAHDGQPVHVHGLSGGAVFVECLTGLDALPARGAEFCFLPLKLRDGTGAPGRAVAWVLSG